MHIAACDESPGYIYQRRHIGFGEFHCVSDKVVQQLAELKWDEFKFAHFTDFNDTLFFLQGFSKIVFHLFQQCCHLHFFENTLGCVGA